MAFPTRGALLRRALLLAIAVASPARAVHVHSHRLLASRKTFPLTTAAGADHRNGTLSTSPQCVKHRQRPTSGRVWALCEGHQFEPPTPAQKLAGVKSSNSMMCTKEMSFEQLCCMDFATVDRQLVVKGGLTLDLAQVMEPEKSSTAAGGQQLLQQSLSSMLHAAFLNDALRESGSKQALQFTVCAASSPTPFGAEGEGDNNDGEQPATASAVERKVECVAHEFSVAELVNSGKAPDAENGNPVLNARVEFLKAQGLPISAIPLCSEAFADTDGQCPCTGLSPASAGREYVQARAQAKPPVLGLTQTRNDNRQGREGTESTSSDHDQQHSRAFFSALQTSGEMTLMQAGGFL